MTDNQNRTQFDIRKTLVNSSEGRKDFERLLAAWIGDSDKFNEIRAIMPLACRQMSQLIAWTWLDDAETEEEKELKTRFTQALNIQAEHNQPQYSQEISDLLTGKEAQGTLTLPEQYKNLAGDFQEYVYTEDFVQYFYFEVVKSPDGYIAFEGDKPDDKNSKIIAGLAYPPRPELDESQVEELKAWATGESGEGWEPPQQWIVLASL
ncbi:hypothetical protein [Oscillatoria sp. FACHB-1406]|uniref:hypothetical protein n=1 Tax=Oscillatoria sp. FACHB-1406 TaxID=2692846 RepID=UPI001687D6AD|nr:hypothetical protein [Oscillatoria sp. FACHB-1406]MBD2579325.1 hypothetical protein [Oscillatoria sp. FACHB-1406]